MSGDADRLVPSQIGVAGLRETVSQRLLSDILQGRIVSGDRLAAQSLASQLGVSATPVREALVELASLGLIEILPNRGAICLPFGRRQLRDMYHLRQILEVESTRLACGRLEVRPLRELRICLAKLAEHKTQGWSKQAMSLDTRLHKLIARGCENNRLCYEIDRYENLIQSIRVVVGDRRRIQLKALEQHIEIVDALIDADTDRACAAMAQHIEYTVSAVERSLFPQRDCL